MTETSRLPLAFFDIPAEDLARKLLGTELRHGSLSGLIVETEAYLHTGDAAAHNARGPTPATRALRMGPGTLYIHPMRAYVGLDIVAANGSVLLRALQPLHTNPAAANGPGKLCRALGITKALYGLNITHEDCPLSLHAHTTPPITDILATTRIGLTKNTAAPLRFILGNNPHLSRKSPH